MLKVIEDAAEVKKCQADLKKRIKAVTTETREHIVGFPGGNAPATVYYSKKLDFWMTLEPIRNRYWNCGGIGYPFEQASATSHIQINPPLSGINRRIAGAFLEDEEGLRYIAHSGKVGGGTKGVSKSAFLDYYPATSLVMSGDKQIPMYVIGRLNDKDLPRRLRNFTKVSADFRRLIKAGKAHGVRAKHFHEPRFSPEFEGTRTYTTSEQVAAASIHGTVVRALRDALAVLGVDAFNTVNLDLYVPGEDGELGFLFEVKSDASTTSIYGAVGQLIFHGGLGVAKRLVAVLPEDVAADRMERLQQIGITVITFALCEDGSVTFDGLDIVDTTAV